MDMRQKQVKQETAIAYILSFVGKPYIYGGNSPVLGLDCSGLVMEYLKSLGILAPKDDLTAAQTWDKLRPRESKTARRGSLIFFMKGEKPRHVAIMLNEWQYLGANGGTSTTLTIDDAIQNNAFIKVSCLYGGENVRFAHPF